MHLKEIERWKHHHNFNQEKKTAEKKTFYVVLITLSTMLIELTAGWIFNSMALFADGLHMGTHATALSISLFAYILARKYSDDKRFTFGSWKIEILGAYTSAVILGIVGLYVLFASIERIFNPLKINYDYALIVAILGLVINLLSALILGYNFENHSHDENNFHHLHSNEKDLNLRSALLHVIADALTSVFAIIALLGAKYYKLDWLDPFMGIIGSILIFKWTISLIKDTSQILLDKEMDTPIIQKITRLIESDGNSKISDIHLLRVAERKYACIISIVAKNPYSVTEYKSKLKDLNEIAHLTIEINHCN